jgi:hypothetical protein
VTFRRSGGCSNFCVSNFCGGDGYVEPLAEADLSLRLCGSGMLT